jgi:FkbH-like protein
LDRLRTGSTECVDTTIAQQFGTAVALLAQFAEAPQPTLAANYLAGWLRIMARQHPDRMKSLPFARNDLNEIWEDWRATLRPNLIATDAARLEGIIVAADAALSHHDGKALRILVIGDCLLWDVALQLKILAAAQGMTVEPTIQAQRVGADLRRALLQLRSDQFDLVFYSPYSYEFSGEYAFVTAPRNLFRLAGRAGSMLQESIQDVQQTIALLARHFGCPIHVHNVSGLRQLRGGWLSRLAAAASAPQRAYARVRLNAGIDAFLKGLNEGLERPVLRIDEGEPLRRASAFDLGLTAFDAGELHPTRLAQELAHTGYLRAVTVAARLSPRKLIVCDLDNTLWDGVIGDGPVRHHEDRQSTLKRLKERGIVLAISSKNDPANVRWEGAVLVPQDFVAAEINWNPKAPSIRRIAEVLNLNPDSFVFLDDRPDEREMVTAALPGLIALDPNETETWALLNLWADMSKAAALEDRTALYQERAARQKHLDITATEAVDIAVAYDQLGLKLSLRHPNRSEMNRVVELINRTNQFNTTGARTTMAEMTSAASSPRMLIADLRDKFGTMGIVGVMAIKAGPRPVISHFVLSCRVFGFGIEDAMLNALRRGLGATVIAAPLVETAVNGPCCDVYARNGFLWQDGIWLSQGDPAGADPHWLLIDDKTDWNGIAAAGFATVSASDDRLFAAN